MTTSSQHKCKFTRMSQRHNVGNAPILTVRKRHALSELDSSLDDTNLNRFKETIWSLEFIYIFIWWFSVPLPTKGWWGWWDGRMKGTLCISSIPNSSLSLYCGKREGREEGERMERRVRKAQRRGGWENAERDWGQWYMTSTTEIRQGNVGALLKFTWRETKTRDASH